MLVHVVSDPKVAEPVAIVACDDGLAGVRIEVENLAVHGLGIAPEQGES